MSVIHLEGHRGSAEVSEARPEMPASPAEWLALARAREQGTAARKDWAPGNGLKHIGVANRRVRFAVAKYGGGRGESSDVALSVGSCAGAAREAA